MLQNELSVTRFVSFRDSRSHPLQLCLAPDQEIVTEEDPADEDGGECQRFLFVRGPANRPISLIREERLSDGTPILVRYSPDVDEPCP
jgi:hypothetical protein